MTDLKDYKNIIEFFGKNGRFSLYNHDSESLMKPFELCTAVTSGFEFIMFQNRFVVLLWFQCADRKFIWKKIEIENRDLFLNLMKQKLNS